MQTSRTRLAIAIAASMLFADRGDAQTQATPQANMNIYRAGGNASSAGNDPVSIALAFQPGDVVRFPSVIGSTDCDLFGSDCDATGPEGNLTGDAILPAVNVLSGISYRGLLSLPLLGVFLADALPAVAPAALDFRNAENFARLDPELGQIFWIGDGKTGTGFGDVQEFGIPDSATRLLLGFIDPVPGENQGGLLVTYEVVPEPAATALAAAAVAALYTMARRRARGGR